MRDFHLPHVLSLMPLVCGLAAAQTPDWVQADEAPGSLTHIYYDAAFGRAVGFETWPMRSWVFDGVRWTRYLPNELQAVTGIGAAFDAARGEGVLVAQAAVGFNPYRTFVGKGSAWGQAAAGAWYSAPSAKAAFAFDSNRGQVVAFGGYATGVGMGDGMFAWTGGRWQQLVPANRPTAREAAAMALDPVRGRVVLFGGNDDDFSPNYLNDTWEWDGVNWSLRQPVVAPTARTSTMAYDPASQQVVLLGGVDATSYRQDVWGWNGTQWSPRGQLPIAPIAGAWSDGSDLFVVEGFGRANVWKANGTGWTAVFTDPRPEANGALAYDPVRAEVVLAGSQTGADTWRWNDGWHLVAAAGPGWRRSAAMAPLGNDLVFCGGFDGLGVVFDTWKWNGAAWTQQFPAAQPVARYGHALANVGSQLLLFGGLGSQLLDDTWSYDGTNWTQLQPLHRPPARWAAGLAHDPARGRTVLFGGFDPGLAFTDTWEWNGVDWLQAAPVHVPPADGGALVYDTAQARVVLAQFTAVATWDGLDWSIAPASMVDYPMSAAYDVARQRLFAWNQAGQLHLHGPTPSQVQLQAQGCGGSPDLRLGGRPAVGSTSQVHVEGAASVPAFVVFGLNPTSVPRSPSCLQLVTADAVSFGPLDARGELSMPLTIPAALGLRGVSLFVQTAVLDGGPVFGASLSGSLHLRVGD